MSDFKKDYRVLGTGPARAYFIENFLNENLYKEVERSFESILEKGLFLEPRLGHFNKTNATDGQGGKAYSAYICVPGSVIPEAFKVFATKEFQSFLSSVTGVPLTDDMSLSLHYHPENSPPGWIHTDYASVGFRRSDSNTDLNQLSDHMRVGSGSLTTPGLYRVTRSIAMLFYLDDGGWRPGDGGETNLFSEDRIKTRAFEPLRNSLGFFEVSPQSFHAYAGGNKKPRKSLVMWFHSEASERFKKFQKLPAGHTFDDIETKINIDDKERLLQTYQQILKFLDSDFTASDWQLEMSNGWRTAEKILQWGVPPCFAMHGLSLALLRLFGAEKVSAFFQFIPSHYFLIASIYSELNFSDFWKKMLMLPSVYKTIPDEKGKTYSIEHNDMLALIILTFADFLIHRSEVPNSFTLRPRVIAIAPVLGLRLTRRILTDFDSDRTILQSRQRYFNQVKLPEGDSAFLSALETETKKRFEPPETQMTKPWDLYVHLQNPVAVGTQDRTDPKAFTQSLSATLFSVLSDFDKMSGDLQPGKVFAFISDSLKSNQVPPNFNQTLNAVTTAAISKLFKSLADKHLGCIFIHISVENLNSNVTALENAQSVLNLLESCGHIHSGGSFNVRGQKINS